MELKLINREEGIKIFSYTDLLDSGFIYTSGSMVFTNNIDKLPPTSYKYVYKPLTPYLSTIELDKVKDKGVRVKFRSPIDLNKHNLRLRCRNLPGFLVTRDSKSDTLHYFNINKAGGKGTSIQLAWRFSHSLLLTDKDGGRFYAFSPFNPLPKSSKYQWSYYRVLTRELFNLSIPNYLDILDYGGFQVARSLDTYNIVPDYIVYPESSRELVSHFSKVLNKYLPNTKLYMIPKVDKDEFVKYYNSHRLLDPDSKLEIYLKSDFSTHNLDRESRYIYSNMRYEIIKDKLDLSFMKDKVVILLDDMITTGSTFCNLLVPLFRHSTILPIFLFSKL